jgi:hypothetical protein
MDRHVMIDLETLGTTPGCTVLSIGAAEFTYKGINQTFSRDISRRSCRNAGLHEDPETLKWWAMQSAEAQAVLSDGPGTDTLGRALSKFHDWFYELSTELIPSPGPDVLHPADHVYVWGNGADFDLPILAQAFRACGMDVPWSPYSGRCYRTLKNLRPDVKLEGVGVKHNSFHDALAQAAHAIKLMNEVKGW